MIALRNAKLGDEEILAYIQAESWKTAFSDILASEELKKLTDIQKIKEMYKNVLTRRLVNTVIEFIDGKPHCIAGWSKNRNGLGDNTAELICIHSLPDKRHMGYGSVMLRHILDEIIKSEYSEVVLWVFEKNLNARSFYEKHGFMLSERKNQAYGTIEVMYSKKLRQ